MMSIRDRLRAAWAVLRGHRHNAEPALPPAPAPTPVRPPLDAETQAMLDRIAVASADQLPPIVTRQTTDWATGRTEITRQDGQPLTVIERAILDRADELRRQASGG